jgi:hypothetical protein
MAKKDIRNGKESGNWRPSRWTETKLRRYMGHVARFAGLNAILLLGGDEGTALAEELVAGHKERLSAAMLAKLGVATIGDSERDA